MIKLSVINDDLKNDKNYDGKIVNYSINDSYISKKRINDYGTNNSIGNVSKSIKQRNPGIDLIRLIGMYGVIFNHLLYYPGNGLKKYIKFKKELKIIHSIFFWHNNGFALISGIIGYKTNKYSNLLYLWLNVFFYSVGIYIYFQKVMENANINVNISIEFFPIIFIRYWYFTTYFGMYLFLPVINKGISFLTKSELKFVVISTLGIFVFWRALKNPNYDVFHLHNGFSILWFLTFYITGAYIGKYRVIYTRIKKIIYCLIYLSIYLFSTFLFYKSYNNELLNINGYYKRIIFRLLNQIITENYDSPIKIMQSISITLFFLQIKYNRYISKFISFFGRLAFGIYLIHINKLVNKNYISNIFRNDSTDLSLNLTIILFLVKSLIIFVICIFIDYLRHLLFTILRVRKICIFLEKITFNIFG